MRTMVTIFLLFVFAVACTPEHKRPATFNDRFHFDASKRPAIGWPAPVQLPTPAVTVPPTFETVPEIERPFEILNGSCTRLPGCTI